MPETTALRTHLMMIGMPQSRLAAMLRVEVNTISRLVKWDLGSENLRLRVSDALNAPMGELFPQQGAEATKLKRHLVRTSMTQRELSRRTGLHSELISKLVRWGAGSDQAKEKVCEALDTPISELFPAENE